jgi:hypothetical protein
LQVLRSKAEDLRIRQERKTSNGAAGINKHKMSSSCLVPDAGVIASVGSNRLIGTHGIPLTNGMVILNTVLGKHSLAPFGKCNVVKYKIYLRPKMF